MDYVFIEYKDSTLRVSEGFECNEALTAVKQAWAETTLETLREDIPCLLGEYEAL